MVVFQFYLPYLLPRTEDWHPEQYLQLVFNIGGHRVVVHPRKPTDPLFPHGIDRELAGQHFEIHPGGVPVADVPQKVAVRDLCHDRLEVIVYGEVASEGRAFVEDGGVGGGVWGVGGFSCAGSGGAGGEVF